MNFDSVDIEGRPSISVRDLRSRIVRQKNLNSSQDSDLVFSDAVTGEEYDDDSLIPSGSSVIIKRVPAGSVKLASERIHSVEKHGVKDVPVADKVGSHPTNVEIDDFDDFGADLCPVHETYSPKHELGVYKINGISSEKTETIIPRCSDPPILRCQKLEESNLSETIHRGTELGNYKVRETMKSEIMKDANLPAMQNLELSSELKCSLCNTFFKDAVMIPCCQHSFCEKCICQVLVEKARCPKCFSSKCRVEDLLPNVSLRQAIEHFLESQGLSSGSGNVFPRYAPDGESGIQAKDVSFAPAKLQREANLPHSPSVTGKGSNLMAESAYDSLIRKNSEKLGTMRNNIKQISGNRGEREETADTDFQGENQPLKYQPARLHDEGEKKRGLWVDTAGGGMNFAVPPRTRRGDRTCYMCGSPDHLIRDCPAASSQHPMFPSGDSIFGGPVGGFPSPYWNGPMFPNIRPFTSMYTNSGPMMPFGAGMLPVRPFAVPPYMPSVYGGSVSPGGFMGMGGLAPILGPNAERSLSRPEYLEHQDSGRIRNVSGENTGRKQSLEDEGDDSDKRYRYIEKERLHERKGHIDSEKSGSYSEDSFSQRRKSNFLHEKHSDQRYVGKKYHEQKSNTEEHAWQIEDKVGRHRHKSSKTYCDRKGQSASDSSYSRHQNRREKDDRKRRDESEKHSRRKNHNHSESGSEQSTSIRQTKQQQEEDSKLSSRHTRHNVNSVDEPLRDRWHMGNGSDEDCREVHHHKRKRVR